MKICTITGRFWSKARLNLEAYTYLTFRIKEGPATLFKKALRIINNGFHDFGPVQRLNTLSVLDVT